MTSSEETVIHNDKNNERKSKNRAYLVILISSFILAAIINPPAESYSPSAQVSSVIGAGLALAAIPLGVVAFLSKAGGFVALAVMAALTFYGSLDESPTRQVFTYAQEGCEFTVEFPSKPFSETFHVPNIGDYQQ